MKSQSLQNSFYGIFPRSMTYWQSHPGYEELTAGDIRLITPSLDHAPASLSWVQTLDVIQYMGADFPSPTLEGEEKRIRDIIANMDEYSWMIESGGSVIGNVFIGSIAEMTANHGSKAGMLTILIGDKDFWGKGIATSACSVVLDWAKRTGFTVITARALQENTGSIKTLEKLRFTETGTEPYEGLVHGQTSMWRNFLLML